MLPSDVPWENSDVWSICAAYFFILHVPLSFGGLSVIAQILHEPNLDPLTMVNELFQIANVVETRDSHTLKKLFFVD